MEPPDSYWPPDEKVLGERLVLVTSKLVALASQYRDALVAQRSAYRDASVGASSVAAGQRAGDDASFAEWTVLQDVKCDLIELHHERDLILVLLELACISA